MRTGSLLAGAAVGAIAGMVAGIVAAAGARAAMRMVAVGVADGVGVRPDFTLAGTLAIVAAGMFIGTPAGVLYSAIADRLPGPRRLHGLLFGLLLLAAIGPFFLRTEEFFSAGRVLLFAPLFPLFGIVLGLARDPASRLIARFPTGIQTALGLAGTASVLLMLFVAAISLLGLPAGSAM